MQKKSSIMLIALLILFTFIMGLTALFTSKFLAFALNSDLYYSVHNKPVIYGTSKITMSKNVVNNFNIKDARFRTFARDFEDGDLPIECTSNNVQSTVPGEYSISYRATDSHNNTSTLTVPVKITDDTNSLVTVERTVYTIPNDWNFQLMAVNRCNTGDRQHLGIYLPAGKSFQFRVLNGSDIQSKIKDKNEQQKIELTNNDQRTESKHYINWTNDNYTSITNTFNAVSAYPGLTQKASVPLLTSPLLARGGNVNTTYKVEVQYKATDVTPLQYYYYQDDESAFTSAWSTSSDEYAMVENEVVSMLLTRRDMHTTQNESRAFRSYDACLEYYVKVVERMDLSLGVTFNANNPVHQNFRAKYLMRANNKGAGEAYYGGDHIGVSAPNAEYFLIMGWGTLHEIAHGYQGYLGKGDMDLLEVGNNIICHYIQMDKTIYTKNEDWLRKYEEDLRNKDRLDGKKFTKTSLQTRLYALVNLLDYFEGPASYAKMFRWYREKMQAGIFDANTPNQDMYALFFAEVYDTNILPYWNQWGLQVAESTVDTVSSASTSISILKDSAGNKYSDIINGKNLNINTDKYKPVADSVLKEYGVKAGIKVTVNIDNKDLLQNRPLFLEQGGKTQYQKSFNSGSVEFLDIAAGSYYLRAPALTGYQREVKYITLQQGEKPTVEITYIPVDTTGFHSTILGIRGIWGHGYKLQLDNRTPEGGYVNQPTQGKITLNNEELDQKGESYWQNHPDEVYTSVTVKDLQGKTVHYAEVKGTGVFNSSSTPIETTIPLQVGYTVEAFTHAPIRVQVLSAIVNDPNKKIDKYEYNGPRPGNSNYKRFNFKYRITELGFEVIEYKAMPAEGGNDPEKLIYPTFSVKEELYQAIKDKTITELNEIVEHFKQYPQNLENKGVDELLKQSFVQNYYRLNEEDKTPYTELLEKIKKGGMPTITIIKEGDIVINKLTSIDFSNYIKVYDNEDREIQLTAYNHTYTADGDLSKPGIYKVTLSVYDADGNMQTCQLIIKVNETSKSSNTLLIILISGGAILLLAGLVCVICLVLNKRKKA